MTDTDFQSDVEAAIEAAKNAADAESGGDPATHVSASVDGRCGFARKFNGNDLNDSNLPVRLDNDNGLHLDILSGTDIQLHKKKLAAYRTFADEMEQRGYTVGLDISSYSR